MSDTLASMVLPSAHALVPTDRNTTVQSSKTHLNELTTSSTFDTQLSSQVQGQNQVKDVNQNELVPRSIGNVALNSSNFTTSGFISNSSFNNCVFNFGNN